MNYAKPLFIAVALASLTLTACSSATGEVEEQIGTVQQAALTQNALTQNALTQNALTQNALTQNALTQNALTQNALLSADLTEAINRTVLKYIVGCALPAGAHIDVTNAAGHFRFDGGLGLAPEWGEPDGDCDGLCKEWVSACVISRLDFRGVPMEISLRGDNPGLATSAFERSTYTSNEATYYGNIFTSPLQVFACLAPGQTGDPRVCGPSVSNCGVVDVVGRCQDVCGPVEPDGGFPNCRAPDGDEGHHGADIDDVFQGSITVFLKP
jgi:hypothetical protein